MEMSTHVAVTPHAPKIMLPLCLHIEKETRALMHSMKYQQLFQIYKNMFFSIFCPKYCGPTSSICINVKPFKGF